MYSYDTRATYADHTDVIHTHGSMAEAARTHELIEELAASHGLQASIYTVAENGQIVLSGIVTDNGVLTT